MRQGMSGKCTTSVLDTLSTKPYIYTYALFIALHLFRTNCKLVVWQQRLIIRKPGQSALNLNCRAATNIFVLPIQLYMQYNTRYRFQ